MNKRDIGDLEREFQEVLLKQKELHSKMDVHKEYYQTSAFYAQKPGSPRRDINTYANLLKVFADKNIRYVSRFPKISCVPTDPSNIDTVYQADTREKILLGTHKANASALRHLKHAFNATVMSATFQETWFDVKSRRVKYTSYDPRYVFFEFSNDNDQRLIAAWAAIPMTLEEARVRYGEDIEAGSIDAIEYSELQHEVDGRDYVLWVRRWDGETRTTWVGNKVVEPLHNHGTGQIPLDYVFPFDSGSNDRYGGFYFDPLVPLQAEYNETFRRKSHIIWRLSNPTVWGRGIIKSQFDSVKESLKQNGGGFVGLKQQGELGILQVNDTTMLDAHMDMIYSRMKDISGFGDATFGNNVGANTSGDALGMYFAPAAEAIEHQFVAYRAFYESINAKTLYLYDHFLKPDEEVTLDCDVPVSTFLGMVDTKAGRKSYRNTRQKVTFTKADIAKTYTSKVEFPSVTPKDEIRLKELLVGAVRDKFISRETAYELWGIESPVDEVQRLENEQTNAALNPDGVATMMSAAQSNPFDFSGAQPFTSTVDLPGGSNETASIRSGSGPQVGANSGR